MEQPKPESIDGKVRGAREIMVARLKDKTLTEKDLEGIGLTFCRFFGFEKPDGESLPVYQDRGEYRYMFRKNGGEYKLF